MADSTNTSESTSSKTLGIEDAIQHLLTPEDNSLSVAPDGVEGETTAVQTDSAAALKYEDVELPTDLKGSDELPASPKEMEQPAEEETVEAETESEQEEVQEPVAEEVVEEESEEEQSEPAEIIYTTKEGDEVTLDELKKGHLRQADYTQKTQALAEERQSFNTDVQAVQAERTTMAESLMMAMNIVEPTLVEGAQTNWQALMNEDAYEYSQKWAEYQQAQVRWGQLQEAGQAATQAQQQQNVARDNAYKAQQAQALQMALPDLADPTKAKALQTSIRDYAVASGLSEQEAGGITDHRIVVMLNKARLYDDMISAGKTVAAKKLSKSPKNVLKKGQPTTKAEKDSESRQQLRANVKKTGSVDAGIEWLLSGT